MIEAALYSTPSDVSVIATVAPQTKFPNSNKVSKCLGNVKGILQLFWRPRKTGSRTAATWTPGLYLSQCPVFRNLPV